MTWKERRDKSRRGSLEKKRAKQVRSLGDGREAGRKEERRQAH